MFSALLVACLVNCIVYIRFECPSAVVLCVFQLMVGQPYNNSTWVAARVGVVQEPARQIPQETAHVQVSHAARGRLAATSRTFRVTQQNQGRVH